MTPVLEWARGGRRRARDQSFGGNRSLGKLPFGGRGNERGRGSCDTNPASGPPSGPPSRDDDDFAPAPPLLLLEPPFEVVPPEEEEVPPDDLLPPELEPPDPVTVFMPASDVPPSGGLEPLLSLEHADSVRASARPIVR